MIHYIGTDENGYFWFWDSQRERVSVDGDNSPDGGYYCSRKEDALEVVRRDAGFPCAYYQDDATRTATLKNILKAKKLLIGAHDSDTLEEKGGS